jgi:hypothetical protein
MDDTTLKLRNSIVSFGICGVGLFGEREKKRTKRVLMTSQQIAK